LGTVNAERAAGQAFHDGLAGVDFLDVHRFSFSGVITDFADLFFSQGFYLLADQLEIELDNITQADKLICLREDGVVIHHITLRQNFPDVLAEQDKFILAEAVLAEKAFNFEVVGVDDRRGDRRDWCSGAQT